MQTTRTTSTRAELKSTFTTNLTTTESKTEEKPNLIGGLEPGAFYSGVSLLILIMICIVLCSCLSYRKKTATVVGVRNSDNTTNIVELNNVTAENT